MMFETKMDLYQGDVADTLSLSSRTKLFPSSGVVGSVSITGSIFVSFDVVVTANAPIPITRTIPIIIPIVIFACNIARDMFFQI